jgi:hypothetical protein
MRPRCDLEQRQRCRTSHVLAAELRLDCPEKQAKTCEAMREGEADDGPRTRDLRLGKPTLYQLSYVRAGRILDAPRRVSRLTWDVDEPCERRRSLGA